MGAAEHRLFLAYLAALLFAGLSTVGQIGITWDEPNYFTSSYSYLSWFGHVAAEPSDWWVSIDRYWEQSHEAPPIERGSPVWLRHAQEDASIIDPSSHATTSPFVRR